jgi:hypothetical protein
VAIGATTVVVAVVVLIIVALAGADNGATGTEAGPSSTGPAVPLAAASTRPSGAVATVAMGDLADPANTFWEMFVRAPGSAQWSLATPLGTASNGGLVAGGGPSGSVTAGVLPSAFLTFSPVASSRDLGATWAPGLLPGALLSAPDALATSSIGTTAAVVASKNGAAPKVVVAGPDLASWNEPAGLPAALTAASNCPGAKPAGVTFAASGTLLVGVTCSSGSDGGSDGGVLVQQGGSTWRRSEPQGSSAPGTNFQSLRLATVETTVVTVALVVRNGVGIGVQASWSSDDGATWSTGPIVAMPAGWKVASVGLGGTGGGTGNVRAAAVVALLSHGAQRRIDAIATPTSAWITLPPGPAGTAAVVATDSGVDALAVSGARETTWSWTSGSDRWRVGSTERVPIQFGSSG